MCVSSQVLFLVGITHKLVITKEQMMSSALSKVTCSYSTLVSYSERYKNISMEDIEIYGENSDFRHYTLRMNPRRQIQRGFMDERHRATSYVKILKIEKR